MCELSQNARRNLGLFGAGVLTAIAVWHAFPAPPRATILREQILVVDGSQRTYRLVIPDSLDAALPSPLIVALPGAGDSPEEMAQYTHLDSLAVKHGFCLVYLEGRHRNWPPSIPEEDPDYIIPDLAYFDAICHELIGQYDLDSGRIYVVGISQGGAFVNLLVAKRSSNIAAALCHSGWLPKPLPDDGIHAARKSPILFVVGAEDRQVPPNLVEIATECFRREGHPVEFWKIPGLGHGWCQASDFNERVWRYLAQHRLP